MALDAPEGLIQHASHPLSIVAFLEPIMANNKMTINLNQYGALVSWSFNVGCGAAQSSSLIRSLNNRENPKAVISEDLPR